MNKDHIGHKIRLARLSKGLTQEKLAEQIGKTRPAVTQIEKTGQLPYSTLTAIAKALNMGIEELQRVSETIILHPNQPTSDNWEVAKMSRELYLLNELAENQRERIKLLEKELERIMHLVDKIE